MRPRLRFSTRDGRSATYFSLMERASLNHAKRIVVKLGTAVLTDEHKHPDPTHGFAWEILFAPTSYSATGMELSFQGELGEVMEAYGLDR